MTVWSLTTDTDAGLFTSLYLNEEACYIALIEEWFGREPMDEEDNANRRAAYAALAQGIQPVLKWFSDYCARTSSCDNYAIERHDHPWVFPAEAA